MRVDDSRDGSEAWCYELVPLLELPKVDLSRSVKAHFRRYRLVLRFIDFIARHQVLFVSSYLAFLAIGTSVFFALAIVAAALGLPSLVLAFSMLRYDLVLIMVKTYDVWFFGVTSTVVSVAASCLVGDARSLLLLISWISFFLSIFADANLFAIRTNWIISAISTLCYMLLAGLLGVGYVDDLQKVDIMNANEHVLPANSVVRDGVVTMTALIVRNLFRRYQSAMKKQQITVVASVLVVRCATFQCRLQLRKLPVAGNTTESRHSVRRAALPASVEPPRPFVKTQLRFAPFLGPLDARDSLFPMAWFWNVDPEIHSWWTLWGQRAMRVVGGISFMVPNAIIILSLRSPPATDRTEMVVTATAAASVSVVFVAICLMTAQKQLLLALVTSFDFLFIAFQGVVIYIMLADLFRWRPEITIALFCDLTWSTWMMCWDAVMPPARKRLGVTSTFAACIGSGLIASILVSACIVVVVLPPGTTNDQSVVRVNAVGTRIEFFVLSWYLNCASTITTWAIRIMWRLWRAMESELVVLDGPVFFEKPLRSRDAKRRATRSRPTAITVGSHRAIFPASQ